MFNNIGLTTTYCGVKRSGSFALYTLISRCVDRTLYVELKESCLVRNVCDKPKIQYVFGCSSLHFLDVLDKFH